MLDGTSVSRLSDRTPLEATWSWSGLRGRAFRVGPFGLRPRRARPGRPDPERHDVPSRELLRHNASVLHALRQRKEWTFFAVLPKAHAGLAIAWWTALILRGVLPAVFAIAMGLLVGVVQHGQPATGPLVLVGVVFVLLQVLGPIHHALSANLGDRTATWLFDRLAEACVRPQGVAHLEDARLTGDLTVARDFDRGMTGPPLSISMDFIASGLVEMIGGVASAVVLAGFAWWAPVVLAGAWLATHWLLRESAIWRDRNTEEVRGAQRDADYAYRLAVDPPASKEIRLFGIAGWTLDRFIARRTRLHELQYAATRLRERSVIWSVILVVSANVLVFWVIAESVASGRLSLSAAVIYVQCAIGTSMIAFGGFSWALDGAAAPVTAVLRLEDAMRPVGTLASGRRPATDLPETAIRFRDVTFAYPSPNGGLAPPVLDHFDLTIPAGSSLAIVGQNGAGKTTLAKLLCRLYDPQSGAIEIDGVDLRELDLASWRMRVAAVFQDFIRFELSLRDNVAPGGAPDEVVRGSLRGCGRRLAGEARHNPLSRVRRWHGAVWWTVAASGARAGAERSQPGRWSRAPRRTDRSARRARRIGDLRSRARGHAPLHDDPHLAPFFHGPPRGPDLRARARQGGRARHARRADGA